MQLLELLHGSDHVIRHPKYNEGKIHNDYGRGFYCTQDFSLAGEWACKTNANGFINRYSIDIEGMKILDLCDGTHTVLEWIAILLKNRTFRLNGNIAEDVRQYIIENFAINISKYDLVRGYRADDSYFQYAEAFVENALSVEGLAKAMALGNLGIQIALTSKKSFQRIEFQEGIPVSKEEYYPGFVRRDDEARRGLKKISQGRSSYRDELFAIDIIREEMKKDDERIQRIVSC